MRAAGGCVDVPLNAPPRFEIRIGWALAHHGLHARLGLVPALRRSKRRARAFGQPSGGPQRTPAIGWALAHHELHARLGLVSALRRSKRSARAFGPPCGGPQRTSAIGWALAHHGLHARLGLVSALRRSKRSARAFGQPCGLPESLFFAWPKKRNQKKGHPSSAPFAHPCAPGLRASAGVRGQCIPALSRTSPASLPATLRADRPSLAAPQGPQEARGLLPAEAAARCVCAFRLVLQHRL
ncbi:hypothetical protein SAMN04488509_10348 [Aquimonas voraii]|uniref:Uncharacterized protein n=1 Tax=Aquimonas voraii TaxID=265719 RepID=A0A1G6VF78_9GAMM|nr:hypothetical protein SAMN04488509_10348 [Aquimonas voraii]